MKYIVFERKNESDQLVRKGICNNKDICDMKKISNGEESLERTIHNLQINPRTIRKYKKEIDMSVFPYFEESQKILNSKTLQTRIVHFVSYEYGIVRVYNPVNFQQVGLQQTSAMSGIFENWNINECIPAD